MAYTFQELAKLKNDLVASFGISTNDAARVVGYCSQHNIDFTPAALGPVFSDLGISPGEPVPADPAKIAPQRPKKEKTIKSPVKEKTSPQAVQDCPQCIQDITSDNKPVKAHTTPHNEQKTIIDTIPPAQALPATSPAADPDIITDTCDYSDLLPPGLYDDINSLIDNYCQQQNITDRMKIHPLQWQGICYRVGDYIKKHGVLRDTPREKIHGGLLYDGKKLLALLALYGVICSDYKQVAFTFNFQRFAGVSREFLNDYCNRGLSSSRVGLREKALELQKASLVGAVTGGGSATVGNIFLSKALAGLQETSTVVHVSASPSVNLAELPKLDQLPE